MFYRKFLAVVLCALGLPLAGLAQDAILLRVDLTDPSHALIQSTGQPAVASDTNGVSVYAGVNLVGFLTGAGTHFGIDGGYPVVGTSTLTGAGATNLYDSTYLDSQGGIWADLNLYFGDNSTTELAFFSTNTAAFSGQMTVDLSAEAALLPPGGTTGPLYSGNSGSPGVLLGSYEVVVPPSVAASPTNTVVNAGDGFTLAATASGGGPFQYQWSFGGNPLTGATNALYQVAASGTNQSGSYRVGVVNSAGNASSDAVTVLVNQVAQSITFGALAEQAYSSNAVTLGATASSGLTVSYRVLSGPASVSGNLLSLTSAGTVVLEASQLGNEQYEPATPVTNSLVVDLAGQSITFAALPDVTVTNSPITLSGSASSGLEVTFSVLSGPASLSGHQLALSGPGVVAVLASQPGDARYSPAVPVTNTFTVVAEAQAQTISFASLPDVSFSTNKISLTASASSGLPVSFNLLSGPASLNGTQLTLTGSGTVTLVANQGGNTTYLPAGSVTNSFVVGKGAQTINFASLPDVTYSTNVISLTASASSGLPITYSIISGPATVSGYQLTLTGAGTVVVEADQFGDSNYEAASPAGQQFKVALVSQTVTFAALLNQPYGTNQIALSASADSGLPVSFSVLSGPASLSGNQLTLTGIGTVRVAATQSGNEFYAAAGKTNQMVVSQATQTLSFTPLGLKDFTTNALVLKAHASSGLPVSFSVVSGAATVSGNLLSLTSTGTVVVQATQAGNTLYQAVSQQQTLLVTPAGTAESLVLLRVDLTDPTNAVIQTTGQSAVVVDTSGVSVYDGVNLLSFLTGTGTHFGADGGYPVVGTSTLRGTGATNLYDSTYLDSQSGDWSDLNLYQGDDLVTEQALFTTNAAAFSGKMSVNLSAEVALLPPGGTTGPLYSGNSGNPGVLLGYYEVVVPPSVTASPTNTVVNAGDGFTLAAAAGGGGPFQYQWSFGGNPLVGATNALYQVGSSGTNQSGSYTVSVVNPAGNATSDAVNVVINQVAQSITFGALAEQAYSPIAVTLGASASSGLTVSYRVLSGPGSLSGNHLSLTSAGTVILEASQLGNEQYLPATPVTNSLVVDLASQAITFAALANVTVTNSPIALSASASSGLEVGFSVLSGPASVSGNLLTLNGSGMVAVVASQPGDVRYGPAVAVTNTFTVVAEAQAQTISFATLPDVSFSTNKITLSASASSGLPVNFSLLGGPAGLNGAQLTLTGAGTVTVVASQGGNSTYLAADSVTNSFVVGKGAQTISFAGLPDVTYSTNAISLNASASSGLPITYSVISGPATVSGNQLTLTGTGTVLVEADQFGDSNYEAASPAGQQFKVALVSQTVTFAALSNQPYGTNQIALSASADSGLPVSFTVLSGPASLSGNQLTVTGIGTVRVAATQSGNDFYAAAGKTNQMVVSQATQTLSFTPLGLKDFTTNAVVLKAHASSGLPVTFSVVSGAATVSGNLLRVSDVGTVVVQATQAGNTLYQAISQQQTLLVTPAGTAESLVLLRVDLTDPTNAVIRPTGQPAISSDTNGVSVYAGVNLLSFLTGTGTHFGADLGYPVVGTSTLSGAGTTNRYNTTYLDSQSGDWSDLNLYFGDSLATELAFFTTNSAAFAGQMTVDLSAEAALLPPGGTTGPLYSGNSGSPGVLLGYYEVVVPPSVTASPTNTVVNAGDGFTLAAAAGGGGPFQYQWSFGGNPLTGATNALYQVASSGTNQAGSYMVSVVNPAGNATSAPVSVVVNQVAQSITFGALAEQAYSSNAVTLGASASSGLAVSYRVLSGPGTVSGNQLSLTSAGTVLVEASQLGNEQYLPATPVTNSLVVDLASQAITFAALPDVTLTNSPITLSASASSGLNVAFSVLSGPVSVSGNQLTLNGSGVVAVVASQPGDARYGAAVTVTNTFSVVAQAQAQTISFASLPDVSFSTNKVALSASASSGLPVSFSVLSGPASVNGTQLTLSGAGTVIVVAGQGGNATYLAANPVTNSFVVGKGAQAISFASLPDVTYSTNAISLGATASSGLPITYSIVSGPANLNGNLLTLTGTGTVVVGAEQLGDSNYEAASPVGVQFKVSRVSQTVTFAALSNQPYGTNQITLSASADSGLPVSFSLLSGPASLNGNILSLTGLGTVRVAATQSGNDFYAAAGKTNQMVVSQATQTLSFTPLGLKDFTTNALVLKAHASSGLPVTFSVVSGAATVSGNLLSVSDVGTVVVQATQAGNTLYQAISQQQTLLVTPAGTAESLVLLRVNLTDPTNAVIQTTGQSALAVDTSGVSIYDGVNLLSFLTGTGTHFGADGGYPVVGTSTLSGAGATNLYDSTYLDSQSGDWSDLNLYQGDDLVTEQALFTTNAAAFSGKMTVDLSAEAAFLPPGGTTGPLYSGNSGSPGVLLGYYEVVVPPSVTASPTNTVVNAGDGFTLAAAAGGGGPFQYQWSFGGSPLVSATNALYQVAFSSTNQTGSYTVSVVNPAGSAASDAVTVVVKQVAQSITFGALAERAYSSNAVALGASASSGLTVSYRVLSGPATVGGNLLSLTSAGTVVLEASQVGNEQYLPATPVTNSLVVDLANQTITFAALPDVTIATSPLTLSASASSGLNVTFSVLSGPASVSGNQVNLSGTGVVVVVASQGGDTRYAAAAAVTNAFTVVAEAQAQTISFTSLPDVSFSTNRVALSASASSGLPVSFSVLGGPASVNGTQLTLSGAGTVIVVASQAGTPTYLAADPVTNSFVVGKGAQTISFASLPDVTYSTNAISLGATASSGLPITYSIVSGPATVSGNQLTLTGTGTVVVGAEQLGDANYDAASPAGQQFKVALVSQTVTFAALGDQPYGTNQITLSASASSGLPVSLSVLSGPASLNGNQLTLTGIGTVRVAATQAGNDFYAAAGKTNQMVVSQATQTLNFVPLGLKDLTTNAVTLKAQASSGLPVSFSVVSGPATISGNLLSLTNTGTVVVQATQAGNTLYQPVSEQQTLLVTPAGTAESLVVLRVVLTDPSHALIEPSGQSALEVDTSGLSVYAGVNLLNFLTGAGTHFGTDGGYPVIGTSSLSGAGTTNLYNTTYLDLQSGNWSDLNLYHNDPYVTEQELFIRYTAAFTGTMTVDLSAEAALLPPGGTTGPVYSGNSSSPGALLGYYEVVMPPSVTVSPTNTVVNGGEGFVLAAAADGGGPIRYQWKRDGNTLVGATNSLYQVTSAATNHTGSYTVVAINPAGSATSTAVSVVVNQVAQSITFGALGSLSYPSAGISLPGSASSGLAVAYRVLSGPATVTGNLLTLTGAGTLVLEASQVGNAQFLPASPVTNSAVVTQGFGAVVGRWIFYNNSAWDGNNSGADSQDDAAIAVDKAALLPGGQASFTNYTSYSRGINGIMVDLLGVSNPAAISAADFGFTQGNNSSVAGWTTAPVPNSITVRPGGGVNGSTRITLIWADSQITNTWLAVTVKANAHTLLQAPDQFLFGNAMGETGNSPANAQVNLQDDALIRANPATFLNPAAITSRYDINRDSRVNIADEAITRSHITTFLTALKLLDLSGYSPTSGSHAAVSATIGFPPGTTAIVQSDQSELMIESMIEPAAAAQIWVSRTPLGPWAVVDSDKPEVTAGGVLRWRLMVPAGDAGNFYRVGSDGGDGNLAK